MDVVNAIDRSPLDADALPSSRVDVDNSVGVPHAGAGRTDCVDGSIAIASGRPYSEVKAGIDDLHAASARDMRTGDGMVRTSAVDDALDGLGINHRRVVDGVPQERYVTRADGMQELSMVQPDPPSAEALTGMLQEGNLLLPEPGHMRVATGTQVVNGRTYVRVVESQGNPPFSQLIPYERLAGRARWFHARLITP